MFAETPRRLVVLPTQVPSGLNVKAALIKFPMQEYITPLQVGQGCKRDVCAERDVLQQEPRAAGTPHPTTGRLGEPGRRHEKAKIGSDVAGLGQKFFDYADPNRLPAMFALNCDDNSASRDCADHPNIDLTRPPT